MSVCHHIHWRPPVRADIDHLLAVLDDERCRDVLGEPLPAGIERRFASIAAGTSLLLSPLVDGEPAGYVGVMDCEDEPGIELCTFLAPALWGSHISRAAKDLEWAMATELLGHARVLAYVHEDNRRSLKSLARFWPEVVGAPAATAEGSGYLRFCFDRPHAGYIRPNIGALAYGLAGHPALSLLAA